MATYRSICESCIILSLWNSYCCYIRILTEVKRKRALDWGSFGCYHTKYTSFYHNKLHELGKTGSVLSIFFAFLFNLKTQCDFRYSIHNHLFH